MTNLPLFHVFAAAGVLPVALLGRSAMVLIPNPRDLDDVVANIEKTKPTFLPGVPTLFNALLNHPKVKSKQVDMTSIKLCISGRRAAHARHKAAIRGRDRRPDRGGLRAHGDDHGAR